jgi:predicted RNase H-like HicB family nuclease
LKFGGFYIFLRKLYNKTNITMKEITFQVEEDIEDGGYVAEAYISPEEQIVTQGKNLAELKAMIKDALECHFDNVADIPHKVILNFSQVIFAV